MSTPSLSSLIYQLWRPADKGWEPQVYAILDGARDERIYPALLDHEAEFLSLFRGDLAEDLPDVAPYVLKLEQQAPFTQWLLAEGWGKSWGIFAESSATLRELNRHFRGFLNVYDTEGIPLHFRYFDPRVFRVYLPTCNKGELKTVFGPVSHYYVEAEGSETLIDYFLTEDLNLAQNLTRLGMPRDAFD